MIGPQKKQSPLLATLFLFVGALGNAQAGDGAQPWPTKDWPTSTPEEQGMDSPALAKLIDYGSTHQFDSVLIVRHGAIVAEAYYAPFRAGLKHRVYSVTKSVVGALVAIALKEGALNSTTHRVTEFFSDRKIADLDDDKKAMTVQNLLDMTSGLRWIDYYDFGPMRRSADWQQFVLDRPMARAPGTKYNYSSGDVQLLSAILTKLTGESALDYARQRLFDPLDISDVRWTSDPQGISNGGNGLSMLPRDMAKFGYLYLRGGVWDNKEIVPPSWIDKIRHATVEMDVPNLRYGNLFWVAPDKNVYLAHGHDGQRIFVMPEQDIVAVVTATGDSAPLDDPVNEEIDMIAGAVKSKAPLPPDAAGQALLASRVQAAATETPSPVGAPPAIAKAISGKLYRFADNPLRLSALSLNLIGPNPSYMYETGRDAGVRHFEGPIGLDGVYRTSAPSGQGVTAAKGAWSYDGAFVAQFQELGSDDLRRAIFSFEGNKVHLTLSPHDGTSIEVTGEAAD